MAAGKRIRHAAWLPAATFELRLFTEAPTFDSRPKGRRQPSPRVCTFKRLKLLKPHNAATIGLHQLQGLLSE